MRISFGAEEQKLIKARMKRGGYLTPKDVVLAGLALLEQQERAAEFAPGELDRLLAVADAEIERGELLDGDAVFAELRQLGARRRPRSKKAG